MIGDRRARCRVLPRLVADREAVGRSLRGDGRGRDNRAGHRTEIHAVVIITPDAAAGTMAMRPRIAGLVTRQVERMLAGEEPLNVVIRT